MNKSVIATFTIIAIMLLFIITPSRASDADPEPTILENATDVVKQSGNKKSNETPTAVQTAADLINQGEYDKAIETLTTVIETKKDDAEAYYTRGIAYAYKGDMKTAIADYDAAIENRKQKAEYYFSRGTAYYSMNDYETAIDNFKTALDLQPRYAAAYNNRGISNYLLGRFRKALDDFNSAAILYPGFDDAGNSLTFVYLNRGNVKAGMGDYKSAIEDYSQAITSASDDNTVLSRAYNNRGIAYMNDGDNALAITNLEKAVELDPELIDAYIGLAKTNIFLDDKEKAQVNIDKALSLRTEQLTSYDIELDSLSLILDSLKNSGGFPDSVQLMDTASSAYDSQDYKKAAVYYLAYLLLESKSDGITYNYAMSLKQAGIYPESVQSFYRYLYLAPNAEDRDKALETISGIEEPR